MDSIYLGYRDHMYALSSKSGSEPFRFAHFLGDLRWNDPSNKGQMLGKIDDMAVHGTCCNRTNK